MSMERMGEQFTKAKILGFTNLSYFPDVVTFLRERRKRDDSPVVCAGCGATEANPRCLCEGSENRGFQLGEN